MNDLLTIDQLKKEYNKIDLEGKDWLKKVQNEKNNTLNAIATIKMNACIQIKQYLKNQIGEVIIKEVTK